VNEKENQKRRSKTEEGRKEEDVYDYFM